MKAAGSFVAGFTSFLRAARFLFRHPRYLTVVLLPTIANGVLYAFFVYFAVTYFNAWVTDISEGQSWLGWPVVRHFWWVLYAILLMVACYFTFVPVGALLSAPFSDYLSGKIEDQLLSGNAKESRVGYVEVLLVSCAHGLIRFAFLVIVVVILLPLQLIPVVGWIPLTYAFIFFLAWEGFEYSLSRHGYGFLEKLHFLRRHHAALIGLGSAGFLLLLVPLTALFVLPMLAASGTVLYCELQGAQSGEGARIAKGQE